MDTLQEPTKLHLPIMVETDEEGTYIISCPTLKGCHTYGKTIEEGIENIKDVIEMCLEEQTPTHLNRFIDFLELEVTA